jgi:hypothetical protein
MVSLMGMIGNILANNVMISNIPARDPMAIAHSSQLGK